MWKIRKYRFVKKINIYKWVYKNIRDSKKDEFIVLET